MRRALPRLTSVAFRALAIGSRFLLVFGLARLLSPADVGLYGLIAGTISFSMLFVGGEFYTYSQRELLGSPRHRWSFILQHQVLATTLTYACILPLQLLFFAFDLLPAQWIAWFFALLVAEHLAQEVNRLLVTIGRPVLASWVLFVRTGAWVWALLPSFIHGGGAGLKTVFLAWLGGTVAAILTGLAIVRRAVPGWTVWPVDYDWLRRGFRVALVFLASTMCFKTLFTADRYLVDRLVGADLLGVYVVYIGVATAVVNFLDASVFSFLYPRLVAAQQAGATGEYRRLRREMKWTATWVSSALAGTAALAAPVVLRWIRKDIYVEYLPLLWLLLAASVVQVVGMIPHYSLYAHRQDHSIVAAHLSSLVVFAGVTALLAKPAPLYAVGWGLLAALTWIAVFKQVTYRRIGATPLAGAS